MRQVASFACMALRRRRHTLMDRKITPFARRAAGCGYFTTTATADGRAGAGAGEGAEIGSGHARFVGSMAQRLTRSRRARATIMIFLRDFIPRLTPHDPRLRSRNVARRILMVSMPFAG